MESDSANPTGQGDEPTPPSGKQSPKQPRRRRRPVAVAARLCLQLVAAVALGLLILVAVVVGRLATGPLDLGFLTPQLQAALDAQVPDTDLTLGGTVLAWDGDRRAIEIRALDVVVADPGGAPLATVPEMAVRLSIAALLRGTAAPQRIEVNAARLRLTVGDAAPAATADTPAEAAAEFDTAALRGFVADLVAAPTGTGAAGALTEVILSDTALQVVGADGTIAWTADAVDITLIRAADAVRANLAGFVRVAGQSAPLLATAVRVSATGVATATLSVDNTPPALLLALAAPWVPDLPDLSAVAPASGTATLRLAEDFSVVDARLDLAAPVPITATVTPGPEPAVTATFNRLDPPRLATAVPALAEAARLRAPVTGAITVGLDPRWRPARAEARLRAGRGTIDLPELYVDAGPVAFTAADLALSADFVAGRPDRLTLDALNLALGDATATVTAAADRVDDTLQLTADATAANVAVDDLATLWPPAVGDDARKWVTGNLEDGIVPRATLQLAATLPAAVLDGAPAELTLDDLSGEIDFTGVTTHYLRPMPPVRDTVGQARYTASEFIIDVTSGVRDDLAVEAAEVRITGLDTRNQVADIDLTVAGPVTDALTLLDSEPLGYAAALGIDPAAAGGEQRTNVVFRIPLKRDLTLDDVGVAAAASLTAFSLADGPFGKTITGGDLALEVNTERLVAWGDIDLGGIILNGTWTENFADAATVVTQYEATGILSGPDLVDLGLDIGGAVAGDVGAGVTYAILADGAAVGAADLDLTAAVIDVPAIGLAKPVGTTARSEVQFVVENGLLSDIPEFRVIADDLAINGAVAFAPDPNDPSSSTVTRMELPRVAFAGNDLTAVVEFPPDPDDPLDVRLSGARLDIRPFVAPDDTPAADATDATAANEETEPPTADDTGRPFRLTMLRSQPITQVVVTDGLTVGNMWGQLRHDGTRVRDAVINSQLTDTAEFDLVITDETTARAFDVSADDLGALASALGITDSIREGAIRLDGVFDDNAPGAPVRGRAVITDFRMVDAPLLGQILTFPSLVGIANTLQGRGIAFRRGELPFVLTDDTLTIEDGRVRGSQLGILINGTLDRAADTIDVQGEVAPATLINNLLGNVPIVGQVLTGGGEGVFAATYRVNGPRTDPTVSVNPVSVIAPGFIRRIVGGFSDGEIPKEDVGSKFPADQD